ncbi:hypothetical protein V2I01_04000 [Micromonospora sp. BRA006-A]|nr:hypothetical protein [Micromonospora sp. BRA006-A]
MTSVSRPLPRLVPAEAFADVPADRLSVLEAVTVVLTLPHRAAERVDALVVPTGQGEDWRLTDAVRAWETGRRCGLGLRRVDGVVLQAEPVTGTGRQAAWVVEQVRALGIGSVALVVSPYHLVRVYLTAPGACDDAGLRPRWSRYQWLWHRTPRCRRPARPGTTWWPARSAGCSAIPARAGSPPRNGCATTCAGSGPRTALLTGA